MCVRIHRQAHHGCARAHAHAYTHSHTHVTHTHKYIHTHTHTHTHVTQTLICAFAHSCHTHACTHTHTHTHVTHKYMHPHSRTYTLMSHTHTCTHTHTHVTHTYTHSYTRAHIHTYSTSGQTPSIEAGATLSTVSEKGLGRGPRAVPSWGGRHSFPDCRRKSTEPQRSSFASPRSQHFGESHGGSGGQPWLSIPGDCLSESVDKT